jgi:[acyl-carrier-protein] S-malonyltransferase
MAAILGLDDDAVIAVCREAAGGAVVEAVNFNCPGQVVIAGDAAAAQRAIDLAKTRGAKRAVTLPVSVPSHSSLMRGAGEKLRAKLGTLTVRAPAIAYVSAVDARPHSEPADIVDVLVRQISSPVRWTEALRALVECGVAQVIECGPGKVLTTLNRRIERRPDLSFLALGDPASIDTALSATGAASHA